MFSIIVPLDPPRLEQFSVTKKIYDTYPQKKEFIIPTRNESEVERYLDEHKLSKDVKLITYSINEGFNVSKALNIGVRKSKYKNIVITSPEVKPVTPVLEQFSQNLGKNLVCWVDDEYEDGSLHPLVYIGFRGDSPGMYFLAMFQKKDIEAINGWDEAFLAGYAYEDDDFGARWVRAGLPFEIRDDIRAIHQFHPRTETIPGGLQTNLNIFNRNNENGVIRPTNGLKKL